ncbi:flagellar protein FliT [Paraliobacillus salinarum]|uniref:flagellar protein FliT n=1 Tax=Paraliobacillus salinarum TaxID=1158996 RepID=UPI0015F52B46|nr:flagellar protein FliT [Paraliobacillus salinarum]
MTERMNQLYTVSNELLDLLDKTVDEREDVIDEISVLLENRDSLIEKIKPPYTTEEKEIGAKLISLDKKINQQLNGLFDDIKLDMRSLKKQKNSNKKYMNPYHSLTNYDGSFVDKRK